MLTSELIQKKNTLPISVMRLLYYRTGVAALILERNPKLSATKVREIMGKTAQKIGSYPYDTTKTYGTWNERYGYGLVDAYNAVINTPRN